MQTLGRSPLRRAARHHTKLPKSPSKFAGKRDPLSDIDTNSLGGKKINAKRAPSPLKTDNVYDSHGFEKGSYKPSNGYE